MKKKSALIFGSTGLVGCNLLELLMVDDRYDRINLLNRNRLGFKSEKITEKVIDFDQLEAEGDFFQVDEVFICLGTTIQKAGSREAFEKVDLKIPLRISKMAAKAQASCLVMISSVGADPASNNFYLRVKGAAEQGIIENGPKNTYAVRPSMLLGEREEKRRKEEMAKWLLNKFDFIMKGPLKKYRGIHAKNLADAMIFIANAKPAAQIIDSESLKLISDEI